MYEFTAQRTSRNGKKCLRVKQSLYYSGISQQIVYYVKLQPGHNKRDQPFLVMAQSFQYSEGCHQCLIWTWFLPLNLSFKSMVMWKRLSLTKETSSWHMNTGILQHSMGLSWLPAVLTTPKAMGSLQGRYKPSQKSSLSVRWTVLAHTWPCWNYGHHF